MSCVALRASQFLQMDFLKRKCRCMIKVPEGAKKEQWMYKASKARGIKIKKHPSLKQSGLPF